MPQRPLSDEALIIAEQLVRQVYFRSMRLQEWRAKRAAAPARRELKLSDVRAGLLAHGVRQGDVLMVHSGLSKITVIDDLDGNSTPCADAPAAACALLETFRGVIGEEGTLVLPTFPKYQEDRKYFDPANDGSGIRRYEPDVTPSKSGLMTEIFRRMPGALRSRYPLQTVSAIGPLATDIVRGPAHSVQPLPHGPESPYGRLVDHKAWVVSLGIPLIDFCTVVHAAEDARYDEWPVRDFWRERQFEVVDGNETTSVMMLERKPMYSRGYAEELLRRDARNTGVLAETMLGTVQFHGLRADRLFDMMMEKNRGNTYPFLWSAVSRL